MTTEQANIAKLKDKYLEYYKKTPIQRYGAAFVGRTEDTIINWRKDDLDFSDRVDAAKAEWVTEKLGKSPAPWVLERIEREIFAPPTQKHEVDAGAAMDAVLEKYNMAEEVRRDRENAGDVQRPPDGTASDGSVRLPDSSSEKDS